MAAGTAKKTKTPPSGPEESSARVRTPAPTAEKSNLTPAMRQYLEQKAEVGDAILLFRIGDFYETFYDDAKTISRVLGLTLTARSRDTADPVPLAGVPYHAVDGYVARLVRAGYKVAISEQVEDAKEAKVVIRREVVRIITPGTLTDESLLEAKSGSVLAAIYPAGGKWPAPDGRGAMVGLAGVELAGGRFFAELVPVERLVDELALIAPAELLVPAADIDVTNPLLAQLAERLGVSPTARPAHVFDAHFAQQALCDQFGTTSLAGFGFDRVDASICAAASALDYLRETQKSTFGHIQSIQRRDTGAWVMLDPITLRALEVERTIRDGSRDGSLLGAIDQTVNPMGARRLREWLCYPPRSAVVIRARQNAIEAFRQQPDRLARVRGLIREMGDVERISARLGLGRASPRDLVGLGRAARACANLAASLGADLTGACGGNDLISSAINDLHGLDKLGARLCEALKEDSPNIVRDGGFIADGFDAELDRLRNIGEDGQRWLAAFQSREATRTGISSLKVGYNSVFGYYIEITHTHRDRVPADYVRKQTVRQAERYICDELKQHESEVLGAADRALARELELFEQLRSDAALELPRIARMAGSIATLDVLAGLAELSRRREYCRPEWIEINESDPTVLEIEDGRHPVLDITLAERFVPNDCLSENKDERLRILTGPNMAGKSTYIRQIALLTLLAQTGSYVPAKSMQWSGVDRIFARVGASDELARGQSTFMVEMVESARILNNATKRSLVILDEIGRGTSTYDGLSIAWAIAEHLVEKIGCRAFFATHYHELTELAAELPGIANFNVAVREQNRAAGSGRDVVFLHRIVPGAADRSYGVHVAAMAGLPRPIIRRAETILGQLEKRFEKTHKGAKVSGRESARSNEPLLFAEPEAPGWVDEVSDALSAVDTDHLTPAQAHALVVSLRTVVTQPREEKS